MAHGHDPRSAEHIVHDTPAWQAAPPAGLAVFARACAAMWHEIAISNTSEWAQRMAQAAHDWARSRT